MFIEVMSGSEEKIFVNSEYIKEFYVSKLIRTNTYHVEISMSYNKLYSISMDYTKEEVEKFYELIDVFKRN